MGARVLFAGLVAISTVVIAGPASAKPFVAEARIVGPGIDGEIAIGRGDASTLWEYGISTNDSAEALGMAVSDLGVRYLVTYSFRFRDDIRQDLYPYAEGGPVTYTPPHQELTGLFGDAGYMRVTSGWYQSSASGFLGFLGNHGLPGGNPLTPGATGDAAPDTAREDELPWATTLVVLGALTGLSLVALTVRRRMFALNRMS